MALCIHAIRSRRCRGAPDRGTACGIGNQHSIAEKLGHELGVRSLSATGAGPGEFEQGFYELAAFESFYVHQILLFGDRGGEVPVGNLLLELRLERFHD